MRWLSDFTCVSTLQCIRIWKYVIYTNMMYMKMIHEKITTVVLGQYMYALERILHLLPVEKIHVLALHNKCDTRLQEKNYSARMNQSYTMLYDTYDMQHFMHTYHVSYDVTIFLLQFFRLRAAYELQYLYSVSCDQRCMIHTNFNAHASHIPHTTQTTTSTLPGTGRV